MEELLQNRPPQPGKNKWVTLISILGISVGMVSGLLSYLHIQYEKGYDRFHSKSGRIYRIVTGDVDTGEGWVGISAPIPPRIKADVPEIEDYVRLTKLRRQGKVVVHYDNQYFNEADFFLADASCFPYSTSRCCRGTPAGFSNP
ncbi:MAG: ABC transporter permease [Lewinellaceae bacterium]|nr:ABC transporter permease [Lewinellaceae bacterium]